MCAVRARNDTSACVPGLWARFGGEESLSQDTKTAATEKAGEDASLGGAKPRPGTPSGGKTAGAKIQGKDRDMGFALRSVYQKTVEEPVPDDLLALLGKLG